MVEGSISHKAYLVGEGRVKEDVVACPAVSRCQSIVCFTVQGLCWDVGRDEAVAARVQQSLDVGAGFRRHCQLECAVRSQARW